MITVSRTDEFNGRLQDRLDVKIRHEDSLINSVATMLYRESNLEKQQAIGADLLSKITESKIKLAKLQKDQK